MTLELEEEVLLLAIRDIITPRLCVEHVAILQHLFKRFYPHVNFDRFVEIFIPFYSFSFITFIFSFPVRSELLHIFSNIPQN